MAGFRVISRGITAARDGAGVSPSAIAATNGSSPPLSAGPLALRIVNEDITAAVQADVNNNQSVILLPPGLSTISATITPPASLPFLNLVGMGQTGNSKGTYLKLANGVNADMFSIPITCYLRMEQMRLDGNSANNTGGNIVNFPASTGYQSSGTFVEVAMLNAAANCIFVGAARNNGLLVNSVIGAAGTNPFSLNSAVDWRWQGGGCGPATAGNANMFINGTNFKCSGVDIYNSLGDGVLIGFNGVQTFWSQCKINNNAQRGMYFDQWAGGLSFQNLPNDHEIIGCTFSANSGTATNTYSDILLHGVVGINIDADFRFETAGATKPKYHVEDQVVANPAGGSSSRVRMSTRCLSTPLGANPTVKSFGTGISNVSDVVRPDVPIVRQPQRYKAQGFTDAVWDLWGASAVAQQFTPASQSMYGTLTGLMAGDLVSNVFVAVSTLGVGTAPTNMFLGLYDAAGNRLGVTADLAASTMWTATTQIVSAPLTTPVSISADGGYYLAFLQNGTWGTTAMKLLSGYQSALVQGHVIGSGSAMCVIRFGSTGMPSTATLATDSTNIWFGWS